MFDVIFQPTVFKGMISPVWISALLHQLFFAVEMEDGVLAKPGDNVVDGPLAAVYGNGVEQTVGYAQQLFVLQVNLRHPDAESIIPYDLRHGGFGMVALDFRFHLSLGRHWIFGHAARCFGIGFAIPDLSHGTFA